MTNATTALSLEEFLALPDGDVACELIDGQAIPKMSPKFFHSRLQKTLLLIFEQWSRGRGRIEPEWAIVLSRRGQDWVPVPDLTYVSLERLPVEWMLDEACPVPPELVIEILSPGQSFAELLEKATDYLQAGVERVWIVDAASQTITIVYPDSMPQILSDRMPVSDPLLPDLSLTARAIFQEAGLFPQTI